MIFFWGGGIDMDIVIEHSSHFTTSFSGQDKTLPIFLQLGKRRNRSLSAKKCLDYFRLLWWNHSQLKKETLPKHA